MVYRKSLYLNQKMGAKLCTAQLTNLIYNYLATAIGTTHEILW